MKGYLQIMKSEVVLTFFIMLHFDFSTEQAIGFWSDDLRVYPIFKGATPEDRNIKRDFQMLSILDRTLYISAKDNVYTIDLDVSHKQIIYHTNRLEWKPTKQGIQKCKELGNSEEICHNTIKVLLKKNDDTVFICGTNAFKPNCRNYKIPGLIPEGEIIDGRGRCPHFPKDGNIALFSDSNLYSATVTDYLGVDKLIYRSLGDLPNLRTFKQNSRWLKEPFFVHGIDHGQYIYFFFREISVEYFGVEEVILSRVARVCKNDMGGNTAFLTKEWTSFLKARLVCEIPGDTSVHLHLLQSVTDVVQINKHDVIFAIFSTVPGSAQGSAICAFAMNDIEKVFAGRFKEQTSPTSIWTSVPDFKMPILRPGSCVGSKGFESYASSSELPDDTLEFLGQHTLMDEIVQPILQRPLHLERNNGNVMLKIIADNTAGPKEDHTVLFVATIKNSFYKILVIKDEHGSIKDILFLEKLLLHIVQGSCSYLKDNQFVDFKLDKLNGFIYIGYTECVIKVPLGSCKRHGYCKNACIASRDPYCGWVNEECVYLPPGTTIEYEQDLRSDGTNNQHC